jgi:hypothetical protein
LAKGLLHLRFGSHLQLFLGILCQNYHTTSLSLSPYPCFTYISTFMLYTRNNVDSNTRLPLRKLPAVTHCRSQSPSCSSHYSQLYALAPTTVPNNSKSATSQHLEEYGLRIPFIKHRRKVLHVRLTSELATECKEALLGVVKDYTANKAPKLSKSLTTKTSIAE